MVPRLKNIYDKEILPKLMTKLNFKNKHQAPKITKVILNIGLGEDASESKKVKSYDYFTMFILSIIKRFSLKKSHKFLANDYKNLIVKRKRILNLVDHDNKIKIKSFKNFEILSK